MKWYVSILDQLYMFWTRKIFLRVISSKICMNESSTMHIKKTMNKKNKNFFIRYQLIEYEVLFQQMVFKIHVESVQNEITLSPTICIFDEIP